MMGPTRIIKMLPALVASLVLASASCAADDFSFALDIGLGMMTGDSTYQIGGNFSSPQYGSGEVHFPISELRFPTDVAIAAIEAELTLKERFVLKTQLSKNITSDAGEAENSDFGLWYAMFPEYLWYFSQDSLDIYSETEAELSLINVNVGLLYQFWKRPNWSFGAGLGYLYQNLEYDLSNLDQWYPSYEGYFGEDAVHDLISGLVGTYEVTYQIPYAALSFDFLTGKRFRFEAVLGASPLAKAEDRDDHMQRKKLLEGDCEGQAIIMSASARYDFQAFKNLFAIIRIEKIIIETDGTQTQTWYETTEEAEAGTTYTIDQTIESDQTSAFLAIGYSF